MTGGALVGLHDHLELAFALKVGSASCNVTCDVRRVTCDFKLVKWEVCSVTRSHFKKSMDLLGVNPMGTGKLLLRISPGTELPHA